MSEQEIKGVAAEFIDVWLEVELIQWIVHLVCNEIVECVHHGQVCFNSCVCLTIVTVFGMKWHFFRLGPSHSRRILCNSRGTSVELCRRLCHCGVMGIDCS